MEIVATHSSMFKGCYGIGEDKAGNLWLLYTPDTILYFDSFNVKQWPIRKIYDYQRHIQVYYNGRKTQVKNFVGQWLWIDRYREEG